MDLTLDHRARLQEAIRMVNDFTLREAVIYYLRENAAADDCLFFLDVLSDMAQKNMVRDFGAAELHEEVYYHLND